MKEFRPIWKHRTVYHVEVFNVPEDARKWIVTRYNPDTCQLWYWGSWDDKDRAYDVANEIEGIVLRKELI